MKEELLNEEETLKLLKINKAQLENYVREGKLAPLYQESVRKFKLSDISKITAAPSPSSPPKPPAAPPEEEEPTPFIRTQKEGSTRIIEAPTETTKVGVLKTGSRGSTFEAEEGTEDFLKGPQKSQATIGSLTMILLAVAFIISAFSIFMLSSTLMGKGIPQINNIFSAVAGVLPIDKEETTKMESKTDSIVRSAQQSKTKAEALIKETKDFISIE